MPTIIPTPRRVEKAVADSRNKGREGMTRARDRRVSRFVSVFSFSHVLLLLLTVNVNLLQVATYMEPEKNKKEKRRRCLNPCQTTTCITFVLPQKR